MSHKTLLGPTQTNDKFNDWYSVFYSNIDLDKKSIFTDKKSIFTDKMARRSKEHSMRVDFPYM